jgi:hypothetical protein
VTSAWLHGKGGNIVKRIAVIGTTALFLIVGLAPASSAGQEKQQEKSKPAQQHQQQAEAPKQQQQHQQQAAAPKQQHQQQAQAPKQQQQHQQQAQAPRQPQQHEQQAQAPKQQQQHQQQAQAPRQPQQHEQRAQAPKQQQQHQQQQAKGQQNQQRQQHQQTASYRPPQRSQQEQARQRSQPALRLSARGNGRIPDERFHSNFGRDHHFRIGNPVLVGGYSRFQYGGYWFGFVQPWPAGWYYTDDVYIDYVDGGYYMYDPYYPGARFSISVVL